MSELQIATARFVRNTGDTAWLLSRPSTLLPFVLLSGIELILVLDYSLFANPLGSGVVVAFTAAILGEHVWHYPDHILELPRVLMVFETLALLGMGFIALPWGIAAVARHLRERRGLRAKADPWFGPRLPVLFVINAAFVCAAILLRLAVVAVFGVGPLRRLDFLADPCGLVAFAFVLVAGAYALSYIALVDDGLADAFRHGMQMTRRHLGVNLAASVFAAVLAIPGIVVLDLVPGFVQDLKPEFAVFVAVFAVMWHTLVRFFVVGAAVSTMLDVGGRR